MTGAADPNFPMGDSPLQFSWTFSFSHRQPGAPRDKSHQKQQREQQQQQSTGDLASSEAQYLNQTKIIGTVNSIQQFWSVYQFLKRPSELPAITDYHVFRHGIRPVWEDPANVDGGKWILRVKKGVADQFWEDLLISVLGHDLLPTTTENQQPQSHQAPLEISDDEICGLVLSIRQTEDIISVWTRSAQLKHTRLQLKIRDAMKRALGLIDVHITMEYKRHRDAIQDQSSFRNTDKFS